MFKQFRQAVLIQLSKNLFFILESLFFIVRFIFLLNFCGQGNFLVVLLTSRSKYELGKCIFTVAIRREILNNCGNVAAS